MEPPEGVRPWGASILDSWLQSWETTTSFCFQPQSLGCLLWSQDTSAPFSRPLPCGMFRTPQAARPRVPPTRFSMLPPCCSPGGFRFAKSVPQAPGWGGRPPARDPGPPGEKGQTLHSRGCRAGSPHFVEFQQSARLPPHTHTQLPCPGRPPQPRPLSGHLMSSPQAQMPVRLVSVVHYFSQEK